MVEQKETDTYGAEQYVALGGRWERETFDELRSILAEREGHPVNPLFLERARSVSKPFGVTITEDEAFLFAYLLENPVERTIPDSRLLGEVLLLVGNTFERGQFESNHPHIFSPIGSQSGQSVRGPLFRSTTR